MTYRPNCGPTAMARILDCHVTEFEIRYKSDYELGHQWKGRSHLYRLIATASDLGYKFKPEAAGGTLRTWIKLNAIEGRKYIMQIGGHFVSLVDGVIEDQSGVRDPRQLARRRVLDVWFLAEVKS
jgi:hypothetical protein